MGTFIESLISLSSESKDLWYYTYKDKLTNQYSALSKMDQSFLYKSTRSIINKSILDFAKDEHTSPYSLFDCTKKLSGWVNESTNTELFKIANSRFSVLDDLFDLLDAYKYGYISRLQYFIQYRKLTNGYTIYQLAKLVDDFSNNFGGQDVVNKSTPLTVQRYVIFKLLELFDFKSLKSYKYVGLEFGSIYDIRSFIIWTRTKDIDKRIIKKVEQRLFLFLNNEEKWTLFKEELVSTPGENNIREWLNKAYWGSFNSGLFGSKSCSLTDKIIEKECFQVVMYKDLQSCNNYDIRFRILDHLNVFYQQELFSHSDDLTKLYLWLNHPNDIYDWKLIKSHFSELPVKKQIRLLRYVFYLISTKQIELSVDEMYRWLVCSKKKASPIIRFVVYLLKEKIQQPNNSISSEQLNKEIPSFNVYSDGGVYLKDLFYPCNGFLALTFNKIDKEFQSFNGILDRIKIGKKWFYKITFFHTPHDLFGRPIDWLDNEPIKEAKTVLEINLNAKVKDGYYILPLSEEKEIKKFVMAYDIDDRCCLLDFKYAHIEKGYLPRNNAYQPLYTNRLACYESNNYHVCRCGNFDEVDPIHGLPFFWCNKKICARRCNYILPTFLWEKYKFADFLYILLGMKSSTIPHIWNITSEISLFINNSYEVFKPKWNWLGLEELETPEIVLKSSPIIKHEEVGKWEKGMSITKDIPEFDEEDYEDNHDYGDSEYEDNTYEGPTYGRYAGSYAQDELGYSDDDIDTIFDGDPDAYWNID